MPVSKHLTNNLVVGLLISFAALAKTFGQETAKPQQQPEDVVRIYTDLVQTDVMVFDKQGRFVNGLKGEDFDLRVDGKPQPIEFFERVAAGSADEETQLLVARSSGASKPKNAGPVPLDRGRTIFFYVDDFHLLAGDLVFLRKALSHFIDSDLGQNDEAVITSTSGQVGFLQQLTDNKAVLRAAVERLNARPQNMARDTERPPMNEYQPLLIDRSPAAMGPSANNYLFAGTYLASRSVKGAFYARKRDTGTRRGGQAGRKISQHAGRRVCPRRNRARSRRQARRPLHQTSHRDRVVEGPSGGGETASPKERKGIKENTDAGSARPSQGKDRRQKKEVGKTLPGNLARAEARRTQRRLEESVIAPGAPRCQQPIGSLAFAGSKKSRQNAEEMIGLSVE